jgi:hypothetical protein
MTWVKVIIMLYVVSAAITGFKFVPLWGSFVTGDRIPGYPVTNGVLPFDIASSWCDTLWSPTEWIVLNFCINCLLLVTAYPFMQLACLFGMVWFTVISLVSFIILVVIAVAVIRCLLVVLFSPSEAELTKYRDAEERQQAEERRRAARERWEREVREERREYDRKTRAGICTNPGCNDNATHSSQCAKHYDESHPYYRCMHRSCYEMTRRSDGFCCDEHKEEYEEERRSREDDPYDDDD